MKEIALEFYEPLKYYNSWSKVLIDFVLDPTVGPQSRCVRDQETQKAGRKMIIRAE